MKAATLSFDNKKFTRYYVTDHIEMGTCCRNLFLKSHAKRFGLDIETSKKSEFKDFIPVKKGNRIIGPAPGLCPLMSDIRLVQIYDPVENAVYVFDVKKVGESWKVLIRNLLKQRDFIAHNGLFEIKHLTHAGFTNLHIDCSMLLNIMVDRAERSPFEPEEEDEDEPPDGMAKYKKTGYGLDAVIGRLYNVRISKHYQTSNWNEENLSVEQINYAALDALLTYRVGIDMMRKVKEYKMKRAYEVLREMQHVVADMELQGLAIDKEQHKKLIEQWKVEHAKHIAECEKRFKKVNLNSSKQLNEWAKKKYPEKFWSNYWPRTEASSDEKIILSFGKDSLKEVSDILERKFKHAPTALKSLLEYKTVAKLLSTYGESLDSIIHPVTLRLHCSFIIGETRTGRLSSREPNLQNLPRDKSVRKLFIAPAGKYLLVADYSQIEIRSQAALSKDPVMTNAFMKGIDLHEHILKICFGWDKKHLDKLDPENRKKVRQQGKSINFGFAFGMGGNKYEKYALTSYGVKVPEGQGKRIYEAYHTLYKTYSEWCNKERAKCERIGYVRTPLGKIRRLLPEEQYTRSVNTQVQGGAAEAIMLALIYFRRECPPTAKIVSTIHDEIIVESSDQDPKTKALLEECMIAGFSKVFPGAPTNNLVEANWGKDWTDAKN